MGCLYSIKRKHFAVFVRSDKKVSVVVQRSTNHMVSGYAEMAHHRMSSNSYIFENPKLTILTDKEFPICKHGKIVLAIHRKALFWILRAIFFCAFVRK